MTEQYLDGNALAGPLSEIFAVDITAAAGRCANCGLTGPVAGLRLYVNAPGLVARCPGCGAVMLRLVRRTASSGAASGDMERGDMERDDMESAWLDLRGIACLQIPLPPG
jgi:predicted RNA-binding Zn-ribbon protein involved in translation (DUF1610 family)